jgi:hypothetical protein
MNGERDLPRFCLTSMHPYLSILCTMAMGCLRGQAIEHELLKEGERETHLASYQSNSCETLHVWLIGAQHELEYQLGYFLPEVEVPQLQFNGDGMAMLSFAEGCVVPGNQIIVEAVYLRDDGQSRGTVEVYETLVKANPDGGWEAYRPYTLTWLELFPDSYAVEVSLGVEHLSKEHSVE